MISRRDFAILDENVVFVDENSNIINHLECERNEQIIVREFVPHDSTVLELGARYGTVSCNIDYKVRDPHKVVVVEPDATVISALKRNRNTAECSFHIFHGVVSRTDLILDPNIQGYGARTITQGVTKRNKIMRKTMEEIEDIYKVRFDTLVADCEGFLEQFFEENKERLATFRMITFERDYVEKCDYKRIDTYLLSWGFIPILYGFHCVFVRY